MSLPLSGVERKVWMERRMNVYNKRRQSLQMMNGLVRVCRCMQMDVCVREIERERESVCVFVSVCVRG